VLVKLKKSPLRHVRQVFSSMPSRGFSVPSSVATTAPTELNDIRMTAVIMVALTGADHVCIHFNCFLSPQKRKTLTESLDC